MHFKAGVAAVTLKGGRTYHRLIPAHEGEHAIRWFLHEPGTLYIKGEEHSIPREWIAAALTGLERVNPFIKELENLRTQDDEEMALHIAEPASIVGQDVAAVISLSPNAPPSRRTIVIKRVGETHHRFLDLLSPYVEPLHYILLLPYGTLGWSPQRLAADGQRFTQTRWYRTRFFGNAEQMSLFSKLMGMLSHSRVIQHAYASYAQASTWSTHGARSKSQNSPIYVQISMSLIAMTRSILELEMKNLQMISAYHRPSYIHLHGQLQMLQTVLLYGKHTAVRHFSLLS